MNLFSNLNKDEANQLSYGLPLVLSIILFFVNAVYYKSYFVEEFSEFIKVYLFFSLAIFTLNFFYQKKKKKLLSPYFIGVLNSFIIFIFFLSNNIFSTKIYETNIKYNKYYEQEILKYSIPQSIKHLYTIDRHNSYFRGDGIFKLQVNESYFGYLIVKNRKISKSK